MLVNAFALVQCLRNDCRRSGFEPHCISRGTRRLFTPTMS
jgi:hypothetical protein